jgi:ABC-type arginine transport system permease subunit
MLLVFAGFLLGLFSSTLKMEGVRCSEMSVNVYQTTPRHIPEGTVGAGL